jgi:hypothetical protein
VTGWHAFRAGLSCASRYRRVLATLFAVNLLSALLLAVLPALGLVATLGHRPAIRQAADGVDAWLFIETMMAALTDRALGQGDLPSDLTRGLRQVVPLGLATVVLLPLLAWLPATFLCGGLLLTYVEAPRAFRWRRFLWGCWHWFGPFLLLGVVQVLLFVVVLGPAIAVGAGIAAIAGAWLLWLAVPLLVLLAVVWLALFELARVIAVASGERNVPRAIGRAGRAIWHHPRPVAVIYGLTLLLLSLLHVLYRWGLMPHVRLEWWPLVLVVQQAFILGRLWARLVRTAGGVALVLGWSNYENTVASTSAKSGCPISCNS